MISKFKCKLSLFTLLLVCMPNIAEARQNWIVKEGYSVISFDEDILNRRGIVISAVDGQANMRMTHKNSLSINLTSNMQISTENGNDLSFEFGDIKIGTDVLITSPTGELNMAEFSLV